MLTFTIQLLGILHENTTSSMDSLRNPPTFRAPWPHPTETTGLEDSVLSVAPETKRGGSNGETERCPIWLGLLRKPFCQRALPYYPYSPYYSYSVFFSFFTSLVSHILGYKPIKQTSLSWYPHYYTGCKLYISSLIWVIAHPVVGTSFQWSWVTSFVTTSSFHKIYEFVFNIWVVNSVNSPCSIEFKLRYWA